jgi:hypothetical protein
MTVTASQASEPCSVIKIIIIFKRHSKKCHGPLWAYSQISHV